MDIQYTVHQGDIVPHIESFMVVQQSMPCPPGIISMLQHKIVADLSKNPDLRQFEFPLKTCPVSVTLNVIPDAPDSHRPCRK